VRLPPVAGQEADQLARALVGRPGVHPAPDHDPEEAAAQLGFVHGGQATTAGRAP
jgi:hypothetical protein